MNKVFGAHPGFRANHAKGIVVEGNFKASAEAAGLSRAVLFNGSPIPATVRFSDATGIPNIADGASKADISRLPEDCLSLDRGFSQCKFEPRRCLDRSGASYFRYKLILLEDNESRRVLFLAFRRKTA